MGSDSAIGDNTWLYIGAAVVVAFMVMRRR